MDDDAEFAERRLTPRRRVLKPARILIDKKSVISCTVRNLSDGGSRLEVPSVLGIPETFELDIPGEGRRQARRVWIAAFALGVAFAA